MNNELKKLLKERKKTKTIKFKELDLEIRRLRADELKESEMLILHDLKDPELIKKLVSGSKSKKDLKNKLENDESFISEFLGESADIGNLISFELEKNVSICMFGLVEDINREDLLTCFSDDDLKSLANEILSYTNE